jgi:hypothetical protein
MRAFARRDPTDSMPAALRVTGLGHEEQFSPPTLSARYVIRQETFAGTNGNARDAPEAAVRWSTSEQPEATLPDIRPSV